MDMDFNTTPQGFSLERFASPEAFFGPVFSWVWNSKLTQKIIKTQIDEMARVGICEFYIIPEPPEFRPNSMVTYLSPEYLSREFIELTVYAIEYASTKGIKAWLYDEGGWPSGSACGRVVKECPEVVEKILASRKISVKANSRYIMSEDVISAFCGKRRIFGNDTFEQDCEITEFYRKRGGRMPDLTNPDTVEIFFRLTHQKYINALASHGNTDVPCFFTDEPLNKMPLFPDDFSEVFEKEYGYSIDDYLYIFNPEFSQTDTLSEKESCARADYFMLVGKLLNERFFTPLRQKCNENGFLLTGHIDHDHTLDRLLSSYGNPLQILQSFDLPGVDVIARQIFPDSQPVKEGESFFPRIAASAANQSGRILSITESFAVYGNGLTYEEMRWITLYQFVRGIQILNPMFVPLDTSGALGFGERPYFSPEIPNFGHLKKFNECIGRISRFMSFGLPCTDTAVLMPIRQMHKNSAVFNSFKLLGEQTENENTDFDLIDEDTIKRGSVKDGKLCIGHAKYSRILVPDDTEPDSDTDFILQHLSGKTDYPVTSDNNKLKLRCRRHGDELYIMAFAQDTTSVKGTLTINSSSPCYLADYSTGEIYRLCEKTESKKQTVKLSLSAGDAALILVSDKNYEYEQPHSTRFCIVAKPKKCTCVSRFVADKNGIRKIFENIDLPFAEAFSTLMGSDFSGEIRYTYSFDIKEHELMCSYCRLKIDKIEHSAEIKINGKLAGITAMPPHSLDIDFSLLKFGENILEITVANTAANTFAVTDTSAWFEPKYTGPYHEKAQSFEKESVNGGLYSYVKLEFG